MDPWLLVVFSGCNCWGCCTRLRQIHTRVIGWIFEVIFMLFLCLFQPYLEWSYSSRRSVFSLTGGWWVEHSWNKIETNGRRTFFLCASVFGSMFVKIHCWLFECPLVGLRVKEPRPNNLWCSCTSRLGGCWKCFICKTSDMLMRALRNRSCMPALRRTKSCRTWDWMLQMLFLVASCGLVVTDYPHAIYCFNQFSHVKRALLCLIPCPSRWFVDCPSQILAKLGAAGRVDSWEEPSVPDASWQQWYAATVKFVIERNPWKSSGPRLLLWRGLLLMKLCCLCFFHRPILE